MHNQFVSGWVGVVKVMQTEENIYLLTATVLHSQAYLVNLAVSDSRILAIPNSRTLAVA